MVNYLCVLWCATLCCTGLHRAAPGCTGLHRAAPGCTGLPPAHHRKMDDPTSGARQKTAEASGFAPLGATSDPNALPITPSREVSLSQATWERLDQAGYRMGLTQDDRNTPARDERQVPREERSAHDQAAGGKDPTSIGGSRHLYDYLGGAPVDPRRTLSEGGVFHGAGDQLQLDGKPAWDHGLGSGRELNKPF